MKKYIKVSFALLMWAFVAYTAFDAYQHKHITHWALWMAATFVAFISIDVIRYIRGIVTIRRVLHKHPELAYIALMQIEFSDWHKWEKKLTTRLIRA